MIISDTQEHIYEIQVDRGVPVAMRDGTILRADVYQPKAEGKYPVIIERTQCWRGEGGFHQCPSQGNFFAPRGYVYVAQDIRGIFDSEGEYYYGRTNGGGINRDSYDTIEWAAAQPWSNGRVGMVGTCGSGMPQYQVLFRCPQGTKRAPGRSDMAALVRRDIAPASLPRQAKCPFKRTGRPTGCGLLKEGLGCSRT